METALSPSRPSICGLPAIELLPAKGGSRGTAAGGFSGLGRGGTAGVAAGDAAGDRGRGGDARPSFGAASEAPAFQDLANFRSFEKIRVVGIWNERTNLGFV